MKRNEGEAGGFENWKVFSDFPAFDVWCTEKVILVSSELPELSPDGEQRRPLVLAGSRVYGAR